MGGAAGAGGAVAVGGGAGGAVCAKGAAGDGDVGVGGICGVVGCYGVRFELEDAHGGVHAAQAGEGCLARTEAQGGYDDEVHGHPSHIRMILICK